MHASDTSGFSRPVSAKPDSCIVRQDSCFLLTGRETHKIKALSKPKPTNHLTFCTGFHLVVYKNYIFLLLLTVNFNFEQGQKKTKWKMLFLNLPIYISGCKMTAANLIARDDNMLLNWKPRATSPCMPFSPQWSQPLDDDTFKNKISYKNSLKLV